MTRLLTRTISALLLLTLVMAFPHQIADTLREVRSVGLEAMLVASATVYTVGVLFTESFRFISRPPSWFVPGGRGIAQSPGMLARAEDEMAVERRASHEAAHATVALALGRGEVGAHVHLHKNTGGSVTYQNPEGEAPSDVLFTNLVIAVAGFVSDVDNGVNDYGSTSDLKKAQRYSLMIISSDQRPARYGGALTTDGLFTEASMICRQILEVNRQSMTAISTALVEKRELRTEELTSFAITPFDALALRSDG
jgi:hypothetical protein